MHILVLCHEYPPVGGGAATVCRTLCEEMVASGQTADVVTMRSEGLPDRDEPASGLTVHRVGRARSSRHQASGFEALAWAYVAGRFARSLQAIRPFDAVHAHFVMPAGLAAWRLRFPRAHYVVTAHGTDVPGYNQHRFRFVHQIIRPIWRRICSHAQPLVSPSRSLASLIGAAGGAPVVVPNPVDTDRLVPATKQPVILLCSRLDRRKGFDVFLRSMVGVEFPGWRIEIVGEGPERSRLERLAAELEIPVTFRGWLEQSDPALSKAFAEAAVLVFPSHWENLPLALLEGMSSQCAIVCSDIPGNVEAVGETGLLVPAGNEGALRMAVSDLVANESRRRRLGAAARRRAVEVFSRQAVTARYLDLLSGGRR